MDKENASSPAPQPEHNEAALHPADDERSPQAATTEASAQKPAAVQHDKSGSTQIVHKSGAAATAALLVALLALLVAGFCAWQIFEQRLRNETVRHDLAERLSAFDTTLVKTDGERERSRDEMAAIKKQFDVVADNATRALAQAGALEELYQRTARTETERTLAEIEQAINIGMQQLRLAADADAALFAFQAAENLLSAHGQGGFQDLRAALIKDMAQIRALPRVDVSGAAMRLEVLFERVAKLPLAYELKPEGTIEPLAREDVAPADAGWWQRSLDLGASLALDVWEEIASLVRLERIDSSELELLAPAQGDFVRDSLKIRLLTARLSLLADDRATFRADLERCAATLKKFFDPRDQAVIESLQEVNELAKLPPAAAMPDMEGTLNALRQAQARLDLAAERS